MMSFGEKRNDDTASSSLSMERGIMILCLFSMAEEGGLLEEVKGVRNKC